jgi:hypothetical protein
MSKLAKGAYKKLKVGTVVSVGWEDAIGCPMGWQLHSEAKSTTIALVSSAGWVIAKSKKAIQIASHFATVDGKARCTAGHVVIPRSAIIEAQTLYDPKEKDS